MSRESLKPIEKLLQTDESSVYRLLPRQVILYWLEGRFSGASNRTSKYNQLGWSLLLRGFYWYHVTELIDGKSRFHHAGFCIIDLDDKDLFLGGVRYVHFKNSRMEWEPLLWRSTILKHTAKSETTALEFAYGTLKINEHLIASVEGNKLHDILFQSQEIFNASSPSCGEPKPTWFTNYSAQLAGWLAYNLNEVWRNHEQDESEEPYALVKGELNALNFTQNATPAFDAKYLRIAPAPEHHERKIRFTRLNPWNPET